MATFLIFTLGLLIGAALGVCAVLVALEPWLRG